MLRGSNAICQASATVRQTWPAKRGEGGGLSLLGWLLGGSRLGMDIFFSSADLALSEGGLSLLGWLLGGLRLGMGIFLSSADLAHSDGGLSL